MRKKVRCESERGRGQIVALFLMCSVHVVVWRVEARVSGLDTGSADRTRVQTLLFFEQIYLPQ